MKAIQTKYMGPTNFRGSRIKATAEGVSVTVPYADELNSEEAHAVAAVALVRKMGWPGDLIQGGRPDGRGYCFVFESDRRVVTGVPSYAEQADARKSNANTKAERWTR